MNLSIPELSLVVLIGPSGAGKSTFARTHFKATEVLSSDYCRGLVADDKNDLSATNDAFDVLHYIAAKRLAAGRLTVVDATNVQQSARKPLVALAREYHCLPVAIVLNMPRRLCEDRNKERPDRDFGPHVIRQHCRQLRRSLKSLRREGFREMHVLNTPEDVEAAVIERQPLWNNLKHETGPFDIIGDVHGCCSELETLLEMLGYDWTESSEALYPRIYSHPEGRKAVFLGDLVDRGPRILDTYQLVHQMVGAGTGLCIPGNHDVKLSRKLQGRNVQITHGLEKTLAEIEALPEPIRESFQEELDVFLQSLISHYVLDGGRLVVAHAGLQEELQGRGSGKVREFALYGETTGETDEFGLPIRYNWAAEYRGKAMVVYGHTPVPEPEWLNSTINIDTGCVFGGKLTALRYPERELVSVPAQEIYADPIRPLIPDTDQRSAQQAYDDLLDIEDVTGKRIVHTRLRSRITIHEDQSIAALEVMSRFAVDPKWLIYLPPTMSPCETSEAPDRLEHPEEMFRYFGKRNIEQIVCEEKHMGSRAVVILCRDAEAAVRKFGVADGGMDICYTRTGRRFFEDRDLEAQLMGQLRAALRDSGFWEALDTDWVCLDCELMPWSAKAQMLIDRQYAPVGAAANGALSAATDVLEQASGRGMDVSDLLEQHRARHTMAGQYADAYRHYCWPVRSVTDLKLAPFHILATEGVVHTDKDHRWHMETISRHITAGPHPSLLPTNWRVVKLSDQKQVDEGIAWWEDMTDRGGEGMVGKPLPFIATHGRDMVQPAVKCRGREYLRIIYGPEYTMPEYLRRLRKRGLSKKRSLALREFALGIEALERFVRNEPLRRVHECVFGVLALESEPVDPRL